MARQCPKCSVDTHEFRMHGVATDLCPHCSGIWFDAGELPRAAGLCFEERPSGRELAEARRTDYRCPACATLLYERELGEDSSVLVEQCPRCGGTFLDEREFSRVRRHFASAGAPAALRPRTGGPQESAPQIDEDSPLLAAFQYVTGLPLELDAPQRILPPVVVALCALNVLVFLWAITHGLEGWVRRLGLVPAAVMQGRDLHTFLTSMFMHGGVWHIVGNLYFLYFLGDNVEGKLGPVRFLGFYFLCGVAAGMAHVVGMPDSAVPAVGASGAISGVLGAYLVFFPRNRLLLRWLWRWGFYFRRARWEVPAWAYLGFWILMQFLYVSLGLPGVAWWAHIGGFACGAGIALAVRLREREPSEEREWELVR